MDYILKHGNTPVASVEIENNRIRRIISVLSRNHLPLGLNYIRGEPDPGSLDEWWKGRAIPSSRQGLHSALNTLGLREPAELLIKTLSLSLSDHYWLCPKNKDMDWHDVNFFENDFSPDIGDALFGKEIKKIKDMVSPDATSDGWLKKRWIIRDGKRLLVKAGSLPFYQEPFNEALASEIMKRLDIPHVEYTLAELDERPFSVCEDFVDSTTELIPAWRIFNTEKQPNHLSNYDHYCNMARKLGLKYTEEHLDRLIVVDFIVLNTDRHFNNFGAIRNAESLEWEGHAPVYDTGTSLYHNMTVTAISMEDMPQSKPFKKQHRDQIKLVKNLSAFNLKALSGIDDFLADLLRKNSYIDKGRRDTLCSLLSIRVKLLAGCVS